MKKLKAFFNFKFIISLTLIILLLSLVLDDKAANKRADEESRRSDTVTALLQDQLNKSAIERARIDASQIELLDRYNQIVSANKVLLDWLNDNHIVVPTKITKLFVYAPKASNPPTKSTKKAPGRKTTKPGKHHKPPVVKGSSKSLNHSATHRKH